MVAYGALVGPTSSLFDIFTNAVGKMLGNFWSMTFWTNPFFEGSFPRDWTIFYALFWAGYGPFMGLFIARISRGRTVREVIGWGMFGTVAGGFMMLIYCAFSTIFLATTVNSGCYVVAATATRRMPVDADPHRYHCTFWAVAQGLLALGLLAMGGLEVAKIFGNFSGALMALPSLLLTACWLKIIREDGKDLLHTYRAKD